MAENSRCRMPGGNCSAPGGQMVGDLCISHYRKEKRYGDPSKGRTRAPNGSGPAFILEALAYEGDECLIWPYSTSHGYGQVWWNGVRWIVPRLVLHLHTGELPPRSIHAAHAPEICHNRACCNVRHLRWATAADNIADKVLDDTHNRGSRQWKAILTSDLVRQIRASHEQPYVLAQRYGVASATIYNILNRKTWAWLLD